ncbi:MAG: hypothetical protein PHC63_00665 [Candidatus Bathyarchaeota archaeon]|nr:hypothetical protein [Candidatus Bathyarchaeota archaeon]
MDIKIIVPDDPSYGGDDPSFFFPLYSTYFKEYIMDKIKRLW